MTKKVTKAVTTMIEKMEKLCKEYKYKTHTHQIISDMAPIAVKHKMKPNTAIKLITPILQGKKTRSSTECCGWVCCQ